MCRIIVYICLCVVVDLIIIMVIIFGEPPGLRSGGREEGGGCLIQKLENHVQSKLMTTVDVGDADMMAKIVSESGNADLTMAGIASQMEAEKGTEPIDQEWLR